MSILVTGGAGYIGSHTVIELLKSGYEVIVVDNLYNSSEIALKRVEEITGKKVKFYLNDVLDGAALDRIFNENHIDSVIHFAGYKAVGESVKMPLKYYHNNIGGAVSLIDAMQRHNVKNIVFSSTATVYGEPEKMPITEDFPLFCTNPYARTKLFIEEMLRDVYRSDSGWNIALLRYFNPIGAHPSGQIGEDPRDIPNNLMPYITQVAIGKLSCLSVYGNDYPTPDGTGMRDYIHVVDLARAHLLALKKLTECPGVVAYNIGTGKATSVLEMVAAFEKASGQEIPKKIVGRRPGDVPILCADPSKAAAELGFRAEFNIQQMCEDSWRWQKNNPNGYREP